MSNLPLRCPLSPFPPPALISYPGACSCLYFYPPNIRQEIPIIPSNRSCQVKGSMFPAKGNTALFSLHWSRTLIPTLVSTSILAVFKHATSRPPDKSRLFCNSQFVRPLISYTWTSLCRSSHARLLLAVSLSWTSYPCLEKAPRRNEEDPELVLEETWEDFSHPGPNELMLKLQAIFRNVLANVVMLTSALCRALSCPWISSHHAPLGRKTC